MRFTRAATSMAMLVPVALVIASVPAFADPIVWNGASITFTKRDFADWTLSANQDRLTDNVWLTRGNSRPLFNIAVEDSFQTFTAPFDTEWAFGPNQPGNAGPITASNFANLVFRPFVPALNDAVGENAVRYGSGVLHLISSDIYLDIRFTSWTAGEDRGAGFSYVRSTPVEVPTPEPSSAALLIMGGAVWAGVMAARRTRTDTIAVPGAHG